MGRYCIMICCGLFFLLRGLEADMQTPLACYTSGGQNVNQTLENTIHLSDAVLTGRIVSVEKGKFGTHSAVVSYSRAYKDDGFLQKPFFSYTTVTNFVSAPVIGQFQVFFLLREPSMLLSLLCATPVYMLLQDYEEGSFQEIVEHISEVASNDTKRNNQFTVTYPGACDSGTCGDGAYCSELNTLPEVDTRCSCLTGFEWNPASDSCRAIVPAAACPKCSHNARCFPPDRLQLSAQCRCHHINCTGVLQKNICGSDGQSYSGICQMRLKSCLQQKSIYKLHDGRCQPNAPQPCMGSGQPLATSVGLVQCVQTDSTSCPPQYFCYPSHPQHSICCPVLYRPTPTSTLQVPASTTVIQPVPSNSPSCRNAGSGDASTRGDGKRSASGDGEDAENEDSC